MSPSLYYILIGLLIGQSIIICLLLSLNRRLQRTIITVCKLHLKSIAMNRNSYLKIYEHVTGKKLEVPDGDI